MALQTLDLVFFFLTLAPVIVVGVLMCRLQRGVADFLAGNRCAGRYLLGTAQWGALSSVVGAVAVWELMVESGWSLELLRIDLSTVLVALLAASGFVAYRFRQTRALTLAEFLEMRYGRAVRVFAGLLIFVSGLINFGIFPAVGARFFVALGGLPSTLTFAGGTLSTQVLFMAATLAIALAGVLAGGQVLLLAAGGVLGLLASFHFLALVGAVAMRIRWDQALWVLSAGAPGHSRIDPFDVSARQDFNLWYILLGWIFTAYTWRAWQGQGGFASAAASPHEARMALVVVRWRDWFKTLVFGLLGLAALVFLEHPDFADEARLVGEAVRVEASETLRHQALVPTALSRLLPEGLLGLLFAAMLGGMLLCDGSMMQSFGSVFVQDVFLPLWRRPLTTERHLLLLRLSIGGVAVWAFCFSLWFEHVDYVILFQIASSAIYLAGAGAVIIGGLYWSGGTREGALAALAVGGVAAGGGMLLQHNWTSVTAWLEWQRLDGGAWVRWVPQPPEVFPGNGQTISVVACCLAALAYALASLIVRREPFPLSTLMREGKQASRGQTKEEEVAGNASAGDSAEALARDRRFCRITVVAFSVAACLAGAAFAWNILVARWTEEGWALHQLLRSGVVLAVLAPPMTVWLGVETVRDLRRMARALRCSKRDPSDDGRHAAAANHGLCEGDAGVGFGRGEAVSSNASRLERPSA